VKKGKTNESQSESSECLFEEVWLKDKEVITVKPVAELEPFFRLDYKDFYSREKMNSSFPCREIRLKT
jgi:hypothetical protein